MEPQQHAAVASVAAQQHGLVTRAQLLDAGLARGTIWRWAQRGALVAVGARTFRLATAVVDEHSEVLASCLDRDGTASHLTAAWLHTIAPRPDHIDITITKGRSMRDVRSDPSRLRVHSSTNLPPEDIVVVDGIPTTSLARTLLGIGALVPTEVSQDHLVDVVAEVVESGRGSLSWLQWLLDERRCRGRNGVAALEVALDARVRVGPTESWLEREMLRLLDIAGLARPSLQQRVARTSGRPARVDFLYSRERVVLEVLGYRFHRTPEQLDADTMRANELQIQGNVVLQVTARRLRDSPQSAVDIVAAALARAATGAPRF